MKEKVLQAKDEISKLRSSSSPGDVMWAWSSEISLEEWAPAQPAVQLGLKVELPGVREYTVIL